MESRLTKTATYIFFLSLILLSIIKIEDTDIWVHLSIGREIFNLHAIPSTEPFAYPAFGQEFRYGSWIFGLLLYVTYLVGGYAGIVLLKAAIVCLGVAILYKDASSPLKMPVVSLITLSIFVVLSRYRFVERPDIVLMVLMPFTIYALNAYVYQQKKLIYALPAIATIWAGSQASFILMFVPFIAFIFGGSVQCKLRNRLPVGSYPFNPGQIKTISIILLLSVAATLINPYPFSQYSLGFAGLTMKWAKQNIAELGPLSTPELVQLCLVVAVTLISFILNRKRFSLVHLLLVLPFFILPLSARRFLFFTGIIVTPVIARNITEFISNSSGKIWSKLYKNPLVIFLIIAWIAAYTALGLAGKQPLGYDFKLFGLGVNEAIVPAGTVRYMDQNGISGRISNPFHFGGYIIWTGFPKRTVFIDPRGGLPEAFLERFSRGISTEQLYKEFGFEAIISSYPQRVAGSGKLYGAVVSDPNWALVQWDDVSLLYLRRGGKYQSLIQRDEYRYVSPAAGRLGVSSVLGDKAIVAGVESDLKRNALENPSPRSFGLLGHLYNKTGRYREAVAEYSKVLAGDRLIDQLSAFTGLGTAYYKLGEFHKSLFYYEKAVKIQRDGGFLFNLATVYIALGDDNKAVTTLLEAVKADPDLKQPADSLLAEAYKRLGRK
jgi:hypothetical protein